MAAVVGHGGGASVGLGPRATGAATKEQGGVTLDVKELGGCGVQMRSRLGTAAWAMTKDWGDATGHEGVGHRGGARQGTMAGARCPNVIEGGAGWAAAGGPQLLLSKQPNGWRRGLAVA
jgi:hypothetical protein